MDCYLKKVIVILAAASTACGIQYNGLRVKVGWSDALTDVEYFFKIPRTLQEAEAGGWKRYERPSGPMPELRLYCPVGRAVCPLFDTNGFIAGLQLSLPVDDLQSLAIRPEKQFVRWRASKVGGEPSREYWTATQYFVSEESLKSGAGPTRENGATLQDGGVWVAGSDGRLMRIPSTEAELNSTTFKRQNCIPNMGTHYYYNMTSQMDCDKWFPWFALTTQGDLVGSGFQMFGKLAKQEPRDWFERPPYAGQSVKVTIPFAPKCLGEWADSFGVISLHIYYVDDPWTIRCQNGDSAKPASAFDRLLLNGFRYINQISDELKKVFSG